MRREGLSIRVRTSLCQQLPPDYEEKVSNFHKFTDAKIAEHSIGPHDIINMDEVPLTFDLPLTRTVDRKGESSVTLKTNGHDKTHFTCVLSCTASGEKLPPMLIFKRMTMPKETFPRGIVVKVNKKGWMTESLMHERHTECYGKRPGGFFHKNKALLVLDSMRAHITDYEKEAIKRTNSIPAVIPGGTTNCSSILFLQLFLHPLPAAVPPSSSCSCSSILFLQLFLHPLPAAVPPSSSCSCSSILFLQLFLHPLPVAVPPSSSCSCFSPLCFSTSAPSMQSSAPLCCHI
ncbi:hypothetical protein JOQ06_024214 [Pogonophryne albipinna]|uniref:DDE-1 domain-containing protein n=1 Tax=Pogonophryne albipinna TaxID=1090488 RepID=A0AAD6FSI3_9TELE|nr:hypothetical protein JOQ06_024214 [Pogonophryne albipinna]